MRHRFVLLLMLLIMAQGHGQDLTALPIDLDQARQYFDEAQTLRRADMRDLWGIRLHSRMMFVDPDNGIYVTNAQDRRKTLTEMNDVFVGRLGPAELPTDGAVSVNGALWVMLTWPLPEDKDIRGVRMMQHSMLASQHKLGIRSRNPASDHLTRIEDRILIRLEWRALHRALQAADDATLAQAVRDALLFRTCRHADQRSIRDFETDRERSVGLAMYTGIRLSGMTTEDQIKHVCVMLDEVDAEPSMDGVFAYASAAAYGVLLDRRDSEWRSAITNRSDLGRMTRTVYGITLPDVPCAETARRRSMYDHAAIAAEEEARHAIRTQRIATYRARFDEPPYVELPITGDMRMSFSPGEITIMDDLGTVYERAEITGPWGTLAVNDGVLLVRRERAAPAIRLDAHEIEVNEAFATGRGWRLEFSPAYTIALNTHRGIWMARRK
ncbi:MAG: hypothetical protein AAF432_04570 [Planctomycetota bacterium]